MHRLVKVGIAVDDHCVLAAHLADHALYVLLARPVGISLAQDLQPDFA